MCSRSDGNNKDSLNFIYLLIFTMKTLTNLVSGGLVNLTPHDVTILDDDNKVILSLLSQGVVRVDTVVKTVFSHKTNVGKCKDCGYYTTVDNYGCNCENPTGDVSHVDIPVTTLSFLAGDLPPKKDGIKYIVSLPVAQYAKTQGRTDFLIPGEVVRDGSQILGCKSLAIV